jgi:hypothetical protein
VYITLPPFWFLHRFIAAERLPSTAVYSFPILQRTIRWHRHPATSSRVPCPVRCSSTSPLLHYSLSSPNPLFISHLSIAQSLTIRSEFNLDLPSTIITTATRKAGVCPDSAPLSIGTIASSTSDESTADTHYELVSIKATITTFAIPITTIAFE